MRIIATLFIVLGLIILVAYYATVPVLKMYYHVPAPNLPAIPAEVKSNSQGKPRVPYSQISQPMRQAILAAEDHHFFEHRGVDPIGLMRATIDNVKAGHMVEGASTITQQLAKVMFLDWRDRTASRKMKELIIAAELEEKYSKEQILEAYLNEIYFGRNAYGIEDAAQKYFGVHASGLAVPQAAFLAGVVRAPSVLGAPAAVPEALKRQQQVIDNMEECGYLSHDLATEAKDAKLEFKSRAGSKAAPKPKVQK